MIKDMPIVVGEIKMPQEHGGEYIWKGRCPFCNKKHHHGVGHDLDKVNDAMGDRLAHCAERSNTEEHYKITIEPGWRKEFDKHEIDRLGQRRAAARRTSEDTKELLLEIDEEI